MFAAESKNEPSNGRVFVLSFLDYLTIKMKKSPVS